MTQPSDGYPEGTLVYDGHQMVIISDDDLSTDATHTNNQNAVDDNNAKMI